MGILIGMDEAGYGPNLGPLVVAATAWHVAEAGGQESEVGESPRLRRGSGDRGDVAVASRPRTELADLDLYEWLAAIVCREPKADRLAIADSKALYHPGTGLTALERGVHAALASINRSARSWLAIVDALSADPQSRHQHLPWHSDFDCELPVDAQADELSQLGARLSATCAAAGARPVAIRARLIFPAEFNDLCDRYGGKGAALSHVTIGLLQEIMHAVADCNAGPPAKPGATGCSSASLASDPRPPTSFLAVCDKHGGRNYYHGLLQHFFPDPWIETLLESRAESRYHWELGDARIEVAFRQGGESFLPAALASMTAKYLRELAMKAWNSFWCARVSGLRPTAGYPLDARRFKAEIESMQRTLAIDDHIVWRNR